MIKVMNWGKGIVAGVVVFMLFILGMCIYMFMAPNDEYDHQYYEKGLTFNYDYDREVQVTKDHAAPLIQSDAQYMKITFKQPVADGMVTLNRPSDAAMDKVFSLKSDQQNEVVIPLKQITAGKWQLVFEWESNHKKYLYQQAIYLK
jgi:hypothetical protein